MTSDEVLIDKTQVIKAVKALKNHVANSNRQIFENKKIYAQFVVKKLTSEKEKVVRSILPHKIVHSSSDICLFVKDLDRHNRDYEPTILAYKQFLKKIKNKIEIIPLKKIKLEYNDYVNKRKLSNLFDVFLSDARVIRLLPQLLGKHFISRNRLLIQVKLDSRYLEKEMEKAFHTSIFLKRNKGSCSQAYFGHLDMKEEELADNLTHLAKDFIGGLEGGPGNLKAIQLKTEDSISLPVYLSYGSKDEIQLEEDEEGKNGGQNGGQNGGKNGGETWKKFDLTKAEVVSTVPRSLVLVTEEGEVVLVGKKNIKNKKRKIEKEEEEEEEEETEKFKNSEKKFIKKIITRAVAKDIKPKMGFIKRQKKT